jgi:hypothetical protein
MKNTYRTTDDAGQDKAQLAELWQLVVTPKQEISALQWTWFKKRLGHRNGEPAFCEVTQDGDSEGCFRLHRLPTPAEAEEIRDIVGIRKRVELSAEARASLTARLPRRGTG